MKTIKFLTITMGLLSSMVLAADDLAQVSKINQVSLVVEAKILQAVLSNGPSKPAYQDLKVDVMNWQHLSNSSIDQWLSQNRQGLSLRLSDCQAETDCFENLGLYFGVNKQGYRRKASLLTEMVFQLSEDEEEVNHIRLVSNRTLGIFGPLNETQVKERSLTLTLKIKEILDLVRTGNTGLDFNLVKVRASLQRIPREFIRSQLVSDNLKKQMQEGDFELVIHADLDSYQSLDFIRQFKPLGSPGLKDELEIDIKLLQREFGEAINKKLTMTSFILLDARGVAGNSKGQLKEKNFRILYSQDN